MTARAIAIAVIRRADGALLVTSAVEPGTVRAVEDAILTRARQLRIQDGRL